MSEAPVKKTHKRRWPLALVAIAAIGGAAYAFQNELGALLGDLKSGSAEAAVTAEPPKPPSITVATAERREIAQTLVTTGTLVARDEILVGPQIDGLRLEEWLVEVGDEVKQGQVLARLDRDMLETQALQNRSNIARTEAAMAQGEAAIAEAEAAVVEAEAALKRAETLKKTGNATEELLVSRQAASRIAAARVEAQKQNFRAATSDKALAEAQGREIALRLARTEVKAPAAGIVASRAAQVGQIVGMAGTPLFKLVRDGAIELEAEATETRLHSVEPGQKAKVEVAGVPEAVDGAVRLVEPTVDRSSRLGKVRVSLPADKGLRPGLFARGRIETARRVGVVAPQSSLLFGQEGVRVQVVKDGVVQDRKVKLGLSDATGVEILEGLSEGERVVERAGGFLRDGDRITPVEAAKPVAAAGQGAG
jgi:HlyD family secretion protein